MRRKSIRPADVESAFDGLLHQLTPDPRFVSVVTAMFTDAWDYQLEKSKDAARTLQSQLDAIDDEIGKLVDRIVSASHARVVTAYEDKIDALECKKLVLRLVFAEPVPDCKKEGFRTLKISSVSKA
ncbi:MAG: hypothetical protein AAGF20_09315 [Pseudomonadota bacterium]